LVDLFLRGWVGTEPIIDEAAKVQISISLNREGADVHRHDERPSGGNGDQQGQGGNSDHEL
jgi:hypothetical protein